MDFPRRSRHQLIPLRHAFLVLLALLVEQVLFRGHHDFHQVTGLKQARSEHIAGTGAVNVRHLIQALGMPSQSVSLDKQAKLLCKALLPVMIFLVRDVSGDFIVYFVRYLGTFAAAGPGSRFQGSIVAQTR